jgi:hypothetical protein
MSPKALNGAEQLSDLPPRAVTGKQQRFEHDWPRTGFQVGGSHDGMGRRLQAGLSCDNFTATGAASAWAGIANVHCASTAADCHATAPVSCF